MNRKTLAVNIAAVVVVLGVLGYVAYRVMTTVRTVDIVVTPGVLYPDGESQAMVEVRLLNGLGMQAWSDRTAQFTIVEGRESGVLVDSTALTARIRSTYTTGTIVLRVAVDDVPIPYEVRIPVRRAYAFSNSARRAPYGLFPELPRILS